LGDLLPVVNESAALKPRSTLGSAFCASFTAGPARIMSPMSSGFPSKKQIEREIAILNTPTYVEARESFMELVRKLQQARTADDLRALQHELILDVNGRQKALGEVVAERRGKATAKIERLRTLEPKPKAELAEAQAILRGVKHANAVADALQHATRVLADGIVWRALDYDRSMISILGKEPPVARHADDKGFLAELAALDVVEAQPGVLAIHNDTTNCLRRGDVTAILERDGRRIAIPKEVKAGSGSAAKQVARIEEALGMIHSRRFFVPIPLDTHLAQLAELISEAKATGYAKAHLDCLFVQVIDYRHWGGREPEVATTSAASLRDLGWNWELVSVGMSSVSRIRDRGNPVVELAPVSIFPLPADDVADLLLGFIDTSVHVNKQLLGLRFAERGLRANFVSPPATERHFLEARRGWRGFLMPAYVREQMLHELITAETVVNLSEWILSSGRTREWVALENAPIVGFENERMIWSPDARIELAA